MGEGAGGNMTINRVMGICPHFYVFGLHHTHPCTPAGVIDGGSCVWGGGGGAGGSLKNIIIML